MTDTIPANFAVFQPSAATPDYDSFHEIFDEEGASNALADQVDEYGKTEIDFEVPEETPADAYPTVEQIEATLPPERDRPTVAQIEAALSVPKEDPESQA